MSIGIVESVMLHQQSAMKERIKKSTKRKELYEQKRMEHPERWSRDTRAWDFSDTEWLNPRQEKEENRRRKPPRIGKGNEAG